MIDQQSAMHERTTEELFAYLSTYVAWSSPWNDALEAIKQRVEQAEAHAVEQETRHRIASNQVDVLVQKLEQGDAQLATERESLHEYCKKLERELDEARAVVERVRALYEKAMADMPPAGAFIWPKRLLEALAPPSPAPRIIVDTQTHLVGLQVTSPKAESGAPTFTPQPVAEQALVTGPSVAPRALYDEAERRVLMRAARFAAAEAKRT